MSVPPHIRTEPAQPAPPPSEAPSGELAGPDAGQPRRTRTSTAWVGICTAALASVILIVFMLQNTRSVEISFLWMHGHVPLALALLTAGVGVAIVVIAFGQARIGQLGRAARRAR